MEKFIGDCHLHSKCSPKWRVGFYGVFQNDLLDRKDYSCCSSAPNHPAAFHGPPTLFLCSAGDSSTHQHSQVAQVQVLVWFDPSGGGTCLWEHWNHPTLFPCSHFLSSTLPWHFLAAAWTCLPKNAIQWAWVQRPASSNNIWWYPFLVINNLPQNQKVPTVLRSFFFFPYCEFMLP